jgi:sRNA-binding protein
MMCGPAAPAEKSEEDKAKIKAEREARKAAKEEEQRKQREEKEAKKKAQADAAAAALAELRKPISYSTPELPARVVGDYETMQSRGTTGRTWADISKLGEAGGAQAGEQVWVRGTNSQKYSIY